MLHVAMYSAVVVHLSNLHFDRGFKFQIYMAGRGCPNNKSCHCYKSCVDHADGTMKCLLSHANSNRKHGMVNS